VSWLVSGVLARRQGGCSGGAVARAPSSNNLSFRVKVGRRMCCQLMETTFFIMCSWLKSTIVILGLVRLCCARRNRNLSTWLKLLLESKNICSKALIRNGFLRRFAFAMFLLFRQTCLRPERVLKNDSRHLVELPLFCLQFICAWKGTSSCNTLYYSLR